MSATKIFNVGEFKIEFVVPDTAKDLNLSKGNNVNAYDKNDLLIWNISELLKNYSDLNGLEYYDEMYFDVRVLDNQNIFCVGFTNHCEIDLKTMQIIKLVNNR